MKKQIVLCLFLFISMYGQIINVSKDSLYVDGEGDNIFFPDSLFVYNTNSHALIIDTIISTNFIGYDLGIISNEDRINTFIVGYYYPEYPNWHVQSDIPTIEGGDTLLLVIGYPGQVPITKQDYPYYTDSLLIISNSKVKDSLFVFCEGTIPATAIDDEVNLLEQGFELIGNYPNPFNPTTTIKYTLPTSGNVEFLIFNIKGQQVFRNSYHNQPTGLNHIEFDGSALSSGVYFYQIRFKGFLKTKKFILLK